MLRGARCRACLTPRPPPSSVARAHAHAHAHTHTGLTSTPCLRTAPPTSRRTTAGSCRRRARRCSPRWACATALCGSWSTSCSPGALAWWASWQPPSLTGASSRHSGCGGRWVAAAAAAAAAAVCVCMWQAGGRHGQGYARSMIGSPGPPVACPIIGADNPPAPPVLTPPARPHTPFPQTHAGARTHSQPVAVPDRQVARRARARVAGRAVQPHRSSTRLHARQGRPAAGGDH
jgi:hypothetical protein